jgi:hypothetical protein
MVIWLVVREAANLGSVLECGESSRAALMAARELAAVEKELMARRQLAAWHLRR